MVQDKYVPWGPYNRCHYYLPIKRLRKVLPESEIAVLGAGTEKSYDVKWKRIKRYFKVGNEDTAFSDLKISEISDLIEKIESRGYKAWLLIHSHRKDERVTSCDYNSIKKVQKKHPHIVGGIYVIEIGKLIFYTTVK